ncbi:SGNH/GDSL hydrolase family protein [Streptomyces luteoverticillatus]|uniref:SGNH/GDSL hydrolase family protein n=1 Tax=Streptomyces luteoverticillatus TaxID=66425 RepID=A0A3Q9G0M4_STRLT|nr:SGNH/GDSL hydrolase family protein [Streptomyces luteoverticillatus]AZQ74592.1 SGNH/GDSL hydrolase family protein [Streptomyces luteoverticillatus]
MAVRAAGLDRAARAGTTGGADTGARWRAGWSAPVQRPSSGFEENWAETGFDRQSVRQVVRVTDGGSGARIRLSNRYGAAPLTVDAASLALAGAGAEARPGTLRSLTFDGASSVVVPAGGEVVSDAAELPVEPLSSVTVTVYFAGPTGPATFHAQAYATSFRAPGDRTADAGAEGFTERTHSWYYLSDVEVTGVEVTGEAMTGTEVTGGADVASGTVVAFGDSLTDGFGSTVGADRRYPDALAERLRAAGRSRAVLNAGIGGNLLLNDSPWFGERAPARFDRDVLDKPGVRSVIVLVGLNDIGFSEVDLPTYRPNPLVSVAELTAGYAELVERAHRRGVRVIGGTLLPFKGAEYHTPRAEAKRVALNEWIRTSGVFDAVADFAAALAAPDDAETLDPAYDSGDHKHPNDAGYRVMAGAVPLESL